jgi:hypothetical protein
MSNDERMEQLMRESCSATLLVATGLWPIQTKLAFTRSERLTAVATERPSLATQSLLDSLAASRSLRALHVFGVLAEARFAVAPGAVMERLLRRGDVRLIAFPSFEHWSL